MKTKTGKLLLQKKSKNNQINTLHQVSGNNNQFQQINRPQDKKYKKQVIQRDSQNIKKQDKDSIRDDRVFEDKIIRKLKLQKRQNLNFHQSHSLYINQSINIPQKADHNIRSIEINNLNIQSQTDQQFFQPQQFSQNQKCQQLKQSLQKLQTQNYRLIQQNYLLILYYKRLIKQNKQNLLKIANYMENLQYNQVIKFVYDALGKNKQKQLQISHFNNSVNGDKRNFQKEFQKNYQEDKKNKLKIVDQTFTQFYLSQHICKSTQIQTKKNQQLQYPEQFKRQPKNRHSMLQKLNSHQFQSIPFTEYRSQNSIQKIQNLKSKVRFLNPRNKNSLYSDCQQSFQYSNFDHIPDQISLNENLPYQMNNSSMNQNMSKSQFNKNQTSQKIYANKNQIYKMLLLQASAIEHFCFAQNQ